MHNTQLLNESMAQHDGSKVVCLCKDDLGYSRPNIQSFISVPGWRRWVQ